MMTLRPLVAIATLLGFGWVSDAGAQTPTLIPQATLQSNINVQMPDNTSGLITPSKVRQILLDMTIPEYVTMTDGTHSVSPVTNATFIGATISGTLPNATITINPQPLTIGSTVISGGTPTFVLTDNGGVLGNAPLPPTGFTLTDGTHVIANTTTETVTGAVVGGTSPNATLTISNQGVSVTDGSTTVAGATSLTLNALTVSGTTPNAIATPQWATNTNVWSGTAHKFIDPAVANSAIAPVTFNEATGTFSIDFHAAINLELPLNHTDCPCTVASPANAYAGLSGNMTLTQSATGSDAIGTWGSTWKFPGGSPPALTATANAIDVLPFYCRTTTFCVITFVGNVH